VERPVIVGNRWVLTGAVLYLLEWVAIIPAGNSGPADPGKSRAEVLKLYQDHPKAVMLLVTWVSVVLLGRVLIITGIRAALRSVGASNALVDLAVFAMVASVALEVMSEVFVGAAQVLVHQGGPDDTVLTLDTLAGVCWRCIFGPLGLSVGIAAWSMLRSGAFPTWIPVVGVLGGLLLLVGGVLSGPGYLYSGAIRTVSDLALFGVPLFWAWMLAAGVFLWRRASAAPTEHAAVG
jgi:hypothetical protein